MMRARSAFAVGVPHPRAYGTFPRVLGVYARDEHVLPLEAAVYKMSGQPARRLGLTDRGVLRGGFYADVVVFDPATVRDRATFDAPHQYPAGIEYALVNGRLAVDSGRFVGGRSGRVLRRAPSRP
jgi:N-acyl-D-amino-acid deacylase